MYTIGYAGRQILDFVVLLKMRGIKIVVDVRSTPRSRHWPAFGQKRLMRRLRKEGIRYQWWSRLGGRQEGSQTEIVGRTKAAARELLIELDVADDAVVLMCSERDPRGCHRSQLLGPIFESLGVSLVHLR